MLQSIRLGLDNFLRMLDPFGVQMRLRLVGRHLRQCFDGHYVPLNILARFGFRYGELEGLQG